MANINGTHLDDDINPNQSDPTLQSTASSDNINAGQGDDTIDAGAGDDFVDGSGGDDVIIGGAGNDTLVGGQGSDIISGGDGNDIITNANGGPNDFDQIFGGAGDDQITQQDSSQSVYIDGGAGNDTINAGAFSASGSTIVNFSAGNDTVINFDLRNNAAGDKLYIGNYNFSDLTVVETSPNVFLLTDPDGNTITIDASFITFVDFDVSDLAAAIETSQTFTPVQDPDLLCFGAGTMIETANGDVAVENLREGDLIWTLDHGYQKLGCILKRSLSVSELERRPELKPVCIKAGALGKGQPYKDLLLSPQHRVLISSKIAQKMFGSFDVLVPAIKLLTEGKIFVVDACQSIEYYHLFFQNHEIVYSNGALSESLLIGPQVRKNISHDAYRELCLLFPQIIEQTETIASVRPIAPQKNKIKKLLSRHQKNGKPLTRRMWPALGFEIQRCSN